LKSEKWPNVKDLAKKEAEFRLSGYDYLTPDSLYHFRFGKIGYGNGILSVDDIQIRPVLGSYGYLRSRAFQTDAVDGSVDYLVVRGLDPLSFLDEGMFKADEVQVQGAKIDVLRDKRIPIDSFAFRPMPQYLMAHARVNADIYSVRIRDSRIRYVEFPEKGTMPGMIYFDSLQVDMAPFFLRKSESRYPVDKVRLGIQSRLMNASRMQVEAEMFFREKYPMDVTVRMDGFEFDQASDFLSKTLFVKAVEGAITNGQWEFQLDDDFAKGEMELTYKDLKLQFLDSLTLEPGRGKLKFFTFGANVFAKNANPRSSSGQVLKREIFFQRDKRKFIFNAWWRSTLSGLRATVGLGRSKWPKELRKEEEE
jgi:hypothetical protein